VLAHADGGGVLYLDASADEAAVARMVHDSTDRLGVCNRLNLLLIDRPAHDRLWPAAEAALRERGLTPSLPPHSHRARPRVGAGRRQRGARDGRAGRRPGRRRPDRRPRDLRPGGGRVRAGREGGDGVHRRLHGTGVFWNAPTRLLDGYKLLGLPETGINVDHTPGPAGR
jgi:glutamate-5-semialdehyde dehydrogenase